MCKSCASSHKTSFLIGIYIDYLCLLYARYKWTHPRGTVRFFCFIKLLISLAALGTRRARAKRGIPHFSFFILLSALVCLTLTASKLGGGSEKCKQVCFFAHLALTFDKFGCTRHRQNLKTAFFILLSALICLTLSGK